MVTNRLARTRGASTLGCLFSLILVVVIAYYGMNLGRVWWRYFEIQDRMEDAARFGLNQSSDQILSKLRLDATEVGLPADGRNFKIIKIEHPPSISITTTYHETVDLPLIHRTFTFRPKAEQRF